MQINVEYQPSTAVAVLEQAVPPVASASPHIFPDYVGAAQRSGGGAAAASGGTAAMHSTLSASLSSSGRDSQLPDPSSSPPAHSGTTLPAEACFPPTLLRGFPPQKYTNSRSLCPTHTLACFRSPDISLTHQIQGRAGVIHLSKSLMADVKV